MAMLVAVGGAALGAATGLGWGTGWLAGSVLGNLLFPAKGPDSRLEGPRLGDLTVTSAANGAPIGIGFGTLRMAGNLIWSSGIRERKQTSSAPRPARAVAGPARPRSLCLLRLVRDRVRRGPGRGHPAPVGGRQADLRQDRQPARS